MHNQHLKVVLFYLILATVLITGCAHSDSHEPLSSVAQSYQLSAQQQLAEFDQVLNKNPEQVWSSTLSQKLKLAIHDYNSHSKLNSGRIYGDSVRFYSLKEKCPAAIEKDMKTMGCVKQVDVIREPTKNEPIIIAGKTSPIWQFICPDGGVFKIKPDGDPSNRYTPFPHGSRTLRYPAESVYRDYRDEIAKISEDGHIIPRSPADLALKSLVDGWSADAHVRLGTCAN